MFVIYDRGLWDTLTASDGVGEGGSLETSTGNFAKRGGHYLEAWCQCCSRLGGGRVVDGFPAVGKGALLAFHSEAKRETWRRTDAQMLSSESFIKPFSKGGFPTRRLPQNHCEPLKGRYPCLPLNDLWWGEPWQVYFSSNPRILMSPCSYILTPWCWTANS